MDAQLLNRNFETIAEAPSGVRRLRDLILQLAVQGRLLPPVDAADSAKKLLEEVRTRRRAFVSKKQAKKFQTEKPAVQPAFPCPVTWCWTTVEEVTSKLGAGSTPLGGKTAYVSEGVKFIRSQNVWNNGLRSAGIARIPREIHEKMAATCVRDGDVLLNITGASIGRSALVPANFDEANVSQHVAIVRPVIPELRHFLHLYLVSPYSQGRIMDMQVGISREGLSMSRLRDFPLPLPSLSEQQNIVAKVNELMAFCDDLEEKQDECRRACTRFNTASLEALVNAENPDELAEHWQRICDHFDLLYSDPKNVEKLRKAAFDLGIKGKLTHRDPADGSAASFLATCKAAKAEGGQRPLKRVADGAGRTIQEPFSIPASWKWARLDDIALSVDYGTSQKAHEEVEGIPTLRMSNIQKGSLDLRNLKYIPRNTEGVSRLLLSKGDILFNRTNSYELVGKAGVYEEADNEYSFASYLIRVRLCSSRDISRYVNYYLQTLFFRQEQLGPGVTQQTGQANFNGTKLRNVLIPIPPTGEQRRIVKILDALNSLCEDLRSSLERSSAARQVALAEMTAEAWRLSSTSMSAEVGSENSTLEPRAHQSRLNSARPERSTQAAEGKLSSLSDAGTAAFSDVDADIRVNIIHDTLLGEGPLPLLDALRTVAETLRSDGLVTFKRFRRDGKLARAIDDAIRRGVRRKLFDRPRRGYVRAVLADPAEYSEGLWEMAVLSVLDTEEAVAEDEAVQDAAYWAQESIGLAFARLRRGGRILTALQEAVGRLVASGEVCRAGEGLLRRVTG